MLFQLFAFFFLLGFELGLPMTKKIKDMGWIVTQLMNHYLSKKPKLLKKIVHPLLKALFVLQI